MEQEYWVAIDLYCGIVNGVKLFKTEASAKHFFKQFIEDNGGFERFDNDYYANGSQGGYYCWDGDHNELQIVQAEVEE